MKETAIRTLNGVPEREFRALYKLEKELYDEWRENTHDINAHICTFNIAIIEEIYIRSY